MEQARKGSCNQQRNNDDDRDGRGIEVGCALIYGYMVFFFL